MRKVKFLSLSNFNQTSDLLNILIGQLSGSSRDDCQLGLLIDPRFFPESFKLVHHLPQRLTRLLFHLIIFSVLQCPI